MKNFVFCEINTETLEHLMWECNVTKSIWLNLRDWLKLNNPDTDINIGMKQIILGDDTCHESIMDWYRIPKIYHKRIHLLLKIYYSKSLDPSFQNLLNYFKLKIKIEKYHLSQENFGTKWETSILKSLKID
jgi:hypothetical protein